MHILQIKATLYNINVILVPCVQVGVEGTTRWTIFREFSESFRIGLTIPPWNMVRLVVPRMDRNVQWITRQKIVSGV